MALVSTRCATLMMAKHVPVNSRGCIVRGLYDAGDDGSDKDDDSTAAALDRPISIYTYRCFMRTGGRAGGRAQYIVRRWRGEGSIITGCGNICPWIMFSVVYRGGQLLKSEKALIYMASIYSTRYSIIVLGTPLNINEKLWFYKNRSPP